MEWRQLVRPISPVTVADYRGAIDRYMDQDPELGLFLRLAAVLGARRSGLIALKWRDVHLAAGEVLIASGVVRVAGQPLIDKDTKTHANRRVAVGVETVAAPSLLRPGASGLHKGRQPA